MNIELSEEEVRLIVSRLKAGMPHPEDRGAIVRLAARLDGMVWAAHLPRPE